jgi:hydroxyacylglutathione hydrolase
MAVWTGCVVPWGQPLILLPENATQHDEMVRQLLRIGFDRINGYLADGIEAWKSAGLFVEATGRLDLERLKVVQDLPVAPMIIDVRQRSEFHSGHIEGALNIELGELPRPPGRVAAGIACDDRLRCGNAGYHSRKHPADGR